MSITVSVYNNDTQTANGDIVAPDMNVCNANWADISHIVGIYTDYGYGVLELHEIPQVVRNCVKALNSDRLLNRYAREGADLYGTVIGGTDAAYYKRKISQFMDILKYAQAQGCSVHWD